jgi:nicotinate-nucleotide adenylyltransferase
MKREEDQRWLDKHLTHDAEQLHSRPAGVIYLAETRGLIFRQRLSASALNAENPALTCCRPRYWRISISKNSTVNRPLPQRS